jgi:hypothetical protein
MRSNAIHLHYGPGWSSWAYGTVSASCVDTSRWLLSVPGKPQ